MGQRHDVTAIALALVLLGQPSTGAKPPNPERLAQVTPNTVTGQLDENSATLSDGSYFNIHTFEGIAGDIIIIDLVSADFDSYLILVGPEGNQIAEDDNGGDITNARLAVTLPATGTYQIVANSYGAGDTGQYTLTWRSGTAADVAQTNALQQAVALDQQAFELYQAGRYGEAEPLLQQALTIRRQQLENTHIDVAQSLNNLALLYQAQSRYGEAEPLHQKALAIRRQQLGENHADVAISLNSLAETYRAQGRYGEAEPLYQESLAIFREQLGEHHPNVATNLNNLAALYQDQGRYGEAEPLYQESLAIRREQLGEYHPNVATSLNNLATLYRDQSRYGEAEFLFQEALTIRREQLGDGHPDVATSFNNLAVLYRIQGRYGEAEPLYQQALTIYRQQLGDTHPAVATSLNNLAALYDAQGRYTEAESLYQEALVIRREQLGQRHLLVANSLNNLAGLYRAQGRYGEAEPLYQRSLAIYREQLGDGHPDVAISLNNLALLYRVQGRYGEAEPLYQEALTIWREQLGDTHPHVAASLNNLAALYQAQGNIAQAVTALQAGLNLEELHLELNLATLADTQRQAYAATLSGTTDAAISFHLQSGSDSLEAAQLALTTLLRRKGRILDVGTSSRQVLRQNLTPDDQATLDQLTDTQRQLANLTFNPPPDLPPDRYRAQLAALETTANQLETTLARRSATFRAETTPVTIAAVQAQIPANGVLVEYVRYRPLNAQDPQNRWGAARYAAYLLFPDGRIEAVDLGDAAEIDAAVRSFVGLLQNRSVELRRAGDAPRLRDDVVEQIASTIKARLFDPIAPRLQGQEHLLISPDSQLNLVPFEALQPEAGGDYLVQQYQISYLNTGRDLVKFGIVPPSTNPALVLANPDYNIASSSPLPNLGEGLGERASALSQLQVGPLPGTAVEAEAIAPLLPGATILTEADATENALKAFPAPRILHIATHGFFLADVERLAPDSRGLGILSTDNPLASNAPVGIAVENPLLRSGLTLAGFNARSSGDEDGALTALEASQLNLLGTQLVVLSACDTGLGDVVNGEGVYGLRRAFGLAGAETQLLSLWQVSDFGTQSLMTLYYEKLMAGMGRSEALRAVQLEMINQGGQYSHPYYWSAFVLTGDWRPL